jgi:hypothetical protein
MKPIIARKGSRYEGWSFNQIVQAYKKGVKLPDLRKKSPTPLPKKNQTQKVDPKYKLIEGLTTDEIQELLEAQKRLKEFEDRNKTDAQRSKEALELEIRKLKQSLTNKSKEVEDLSRRLNEKSKTIEDRMRSEIIQKYGKEAGAISIKALLRDENLKRRIYVDDGAEDIHFLDEKGENMNVSPNEFFEILKNHSDYQDLFSSYHNIGANGVGAYRGSAKDMPKTPQEQIKVGIKNRLGN